MEAAGESGRAAARAGDGQRGAGWALAVLEHAYDIVLLLDGAGRVAYVNAAVERLLGIPPPAMLGRSALDRVHPEDAENVRGRIAAHLAGAETAEPMIYRLRHADGSWRWVESITASRLDDPAVRGVVVSTRDATERVRTEAALRDCERRAREHLAAADRAARELALLDRVRAALARQLDLPTLFRSVVEAVAETFGYSQVSLYLREGDESVLQHQVGYDRVLARIPVTVGVSGRVIRTGRPVLLEDVAADPAFLGAIEGIHSEVCVPLRDGDRVVGFLNLESTGGGRLGPGDLRLMEALAEHVGIAIGRTRVYQQARLSEERFRTAFASSAMGTALVGLDGRWLTVNRALCEIVGYTEEELQRRTFQEITHPDDLAEDARLIGLLLAGEIPAIRFEKRYIHQRGYPVWVFVTGSLVRDDDGAPLSFLAQVQDITERRRAAAELAAERDLLDRLLEHLPEAVYVKDAASRFLRLNPTAARLLGANDPAEVLGKTDFDFFSEPMARAYFEAEQQVVATGEPRFNQLETHGEDGPAPAWWLNSTVPLRDAGGAIVGLVGSSREVTERLRAEAELRASEERLRLALEAASMASWDWDAATGAAVRSAAMPALFGLPAEAANAPRQRYRDLVHPDDRPKLRAADRRLTTDHGTYEVEYRVVRPDGQVRWLRDRGVAFLGADGALARVLGITQDVTERKRGEEELVAAKEAAEEANRLKSAFLSTMSHELRTPMNAIIGYAHLLLDGLSGPLRPSQADDVRQIADGADRLLGLIDDVLDLSRIEAGRLDLTAEPVDLTAVVAEVTAQMAPLASRKGLDVVVDPAPGLPAVRADPLRVRQILLNLVGNAVKFTEAGSVRVTSRATEDGVEVAVTDTGIGIAPEVLPHVFDEFRQADTGTTRRYGGSGLGLAISRRLAELHGGTIAAESTPGVGSAFTLRLPVDAGDERPAG